MSKIINRLRDRRAGSTLIEVIVVVVILAILAAVMLPRFFSQSDRARTAGAKSDLNSAGKQAAVSIIEGGNLATVSSEANSGIPGVIVTPAAGPAYRLALSVSGQTPTLSVASNGTLIKTGSGW